MPQKIILYGSPACPMVYPVRGLLQRAKVDFEYIDIFYNAQAHDELCRITNGFASVPTLVFPDGSKLIEPTSGQLKSKLLRLGYSLPASTFEKIMQRVWKMFRRQSEG